jgi:hypothetical protein
MPPVIFTLRDSDDVVATLEQAVWLAREVTGFDRS